MKKRVGILISGRGSNMSALAEAARGDDYPAAIALVISNRPDALGLERAKAAGIKTLVIDHKAYATREAFDMAVEAALLGDGVELVCHAGFMRIQSEVCIRCRRATSQSPVRYDTKTPASNSVAM